MIRIRYRLSEEWLSEWDKLDLRFASDSELRYSAFLGDVELVVGETDLSAEWGWIPILDFVLAFRQTSEDLRYSAHSVFVFTESDEKIVMSIKADGLEVTGSYAEGVGRCGVAEWVKAVDEFSSRTMNELAELYPDLRRNDTFLSWLAMVQEKP